MAYHSTLSQENRFRESELDMRTIEQQTEDGEFEQFLIDHNKGNIFIEEIEDPDCLFYRMEEEEQCTKIFGKKISEPWDSPFKKREEIEELLFPELKTHVRKKIEVVVTEKNMEEEIKVTGRKMRKRMTRESYIKNGHQRHINLKRKMKNEKSRKPEIKTTGRMCISQWRKTGQNVKSISISPAQINHLMVKAMSPEKILKKIVA